jgi:thioredoxin reductase (NADPH)
LTDIRDVIVIGSGPAGYTAALYAARAQLKPLVFEGSVTAGGALMNTTEVENFPGFRDGIMGPALMDEMRAQAERFGTELVSDDVIEVDLTGDVKVVKTHTDTYTARAVILAMGSGYRKLGLPREEELSGRGVSWCATCDGFFFRDKDIAVIGGGDSAMEDSIFISKFADDLTVVHRRDEFRASKIMEERARDRDNISFKTPYVPEEFIAGDDGKLAKVRLRQAENGETEEIEVGGAFVAIGHTPRSELVTGQVETDDGGYVITRNGSTRTNLAGVFAVGDLVDHTYRQAITAAGTGCMGALDAEWYLRDVPPSPEAHWSGMAGEAQPDAHDAEERAEVSAK